MNKAIVFNCNYNGLAILQELGRLGIECVAMDSGKSIGTYSKYAHFVKVPNPSVDEKGFIDALYAYCEQELLKPLLIPTNDDWATAISRNKAKLLQVSHPLVADWMVVEKLIKKQVFYKLGKESNYLTPITWNSRELSDEQNILFPIIAKPEYRRISNNKEQTTVIHIPDALRFTIINSQTELNNFLNKNKDLLPSIIFQEYISGMSDHMFTVGIYADKNNEVLGIFSGKKVRGYPAEYGDWVIGENYKLPDDLIVLVKKIVKEIGYFGIAEFEFKFDDVRNRYYLIEINPRSWSWVGITRHLGDGLPTIAYNDIVNGKKVFSDSSNIQTGTVRYLKLLDDIHNCVFLYKKDYKPWSMSFFKWLFNHRGKKTVYADFSNWDLKVSLRAIYGKIRQILS